MSFQLIFTANAVDLNALADAVCGNAALASGSRRDGTPRKIIFERDGTARVNGVAMGEYLASAPEKAWAFLRRLWQMDWVADELAELEVVVHVAGSSPETKQQTHAVARALMSYEPGLVDELVQAGFKGVTVTDSARDAVREKVRG